MLTRDMIIQVQDFIKEEVQVPEWGGSVFIRSMTVKDSDEMDQYYLRKAKPKTKAKFKTSGKSKVKLTEDDLDIDDLGAVIGMRVEFVSRCLCDESGDLLLDDDEGREILLHKNANVIERLYDAAIRVNNRDEDTAEQEKKESPAMDSIALNSNSAES